MNNQRHYSTEELMGFADGERGAGEATQIAGHLKICADCSCRLKMLRTAADDYGRLRSGILRNASSALGDWKPRPFTDVPKAHPPQAKWNSWIWWFAAAACVLVASALFWIHGSESRKMGRLLRLSASERPGPSGCLRISVAARCCSDRQF
ncbi:MAG TPA: hypothetical protein VHZ07_17765 [Bryobacteraceae bacterium]|jgi:hypothetical protein|nr:hypothetical protein [Bryobacteraceae bacterium]